MPPPSGFPIVLSNPPPPGGTAPNGRNGLAEVAAGGVSFIRTGRNDWSLAAIDAQLAAEKKLLDEAQAHGLQCWLWLGDTTNLPPTPSPAGTAAREDRRQPGRAPGARRLQRGRRARQSVPRLERDPARRSGARLQAAQGDRSGASARAHPGAARHGGAADAVSPGVRHHRRRRLSGLVSARRRTPRRRTRTSASSATCTRKMVKAAGAKPCLDDAADRVERRQPEQAASCDRAAVPVARGRAVHGVSGRSLPERADSSSSAAT